MNMPGSGIDAVMRIMDRAFEPHWREAWTRTQIEQSLRFPATHLILGDKAGKLAVREHEAVAFTLSRHVLEEEELLLIAVDPDYRRRGLGAAMLEMLAGEAGHRGVQRLFLEMRANNPAESLYRAQGFEQIGRRADYYRTLDGTRIDAITFARDLVR